MSVSIHDLFDLTARVAFITGGGGLLGPMHGAALLECGARVALVDVDGNRATAAAAALAEAHGDRVTGVTADITDPRSIADAVDVVEKQWGPIGILVNNAAVDPKVGNDDGGGGDRLTRLEHFPLANWQRELDVGVTGTFLCCQIMGSAMAARGGGVILNISSDLGIVAPDQRLYQKPGAATQPVKPITYSAVKHAVIGITRYLATYWADRHVRVNALAPGGVQAGQSTEFLERVHRRIPMGRLAKRDEYKGAVAFLCSDASSYMTGAVVVADGGRTVW